MTDEDKQLIAEYVGGQPYPPACVGDVLFYVDTTTYRPIRWDLNDAALCVQEMQKRGDWRNFLIIARNLHKLEFDSQVVAWLFNAANFFAAMSQWLREKK